MINDIDVDAYRHDKNFQGLVAKVGRNNPAVQIMLKGKESQLTEKYMNGLYWLAEKALIATMAAMPFLVTYQLCKPSHKHQHEKTVAEYRMR